MKKITLIILIFCFGNFLNAQNFNLSFGAGLPLGDASDLVTSNIYVEGSYLTEVSEKFELGGTLGYIVAYDKDVEATVFPDFVFIEGGETLGFLPVALTGKYLINQGFKIGGDIGYAFGLSPSGLDGGVYYAPKVEYSLFDNVSAILSYRSINTDALNFGFINLGFQYKF